MARAVLTRALAALFPPLAVLASAHELFLRNQDDLDRTVSVLHPFWATAAAAVLAASVLQRASRSGPARALLAVYYSAGFGFVLWSFLRAVPAGAHLARWVLDSLVGAALFAAAWVAATVVLVRRSPRGLEPLVAILAALLLGREAFSFATRLDREPPPPPRDVAAELAASGSPDRPNVYHVLFDALPDDVFDVAWPPGREGSLDGFVRFRARAPMRSTQAVLPSILTGRRVEGDPASQVREALLGETSLLRAVRAEGFRTLGVVPRFLYGDHREAFDVMVVHGENLEEPDLPALHAAVFLRMWTFGVLPRAVGERLAAGHLPGLDAGFFGMAGVERLSTYAQPLVSRLSFEELLALEPRLPPRGRYTYVHLLLPHNPYVLREDCSLSGTGPTDLLQQTRCSLLLLARLLDTLRRLDRLDRSLVLVHGDHGSGEVLRDGRLVPDEDAWLRTLVLVKPVGASGAGPREAREHADLVDIAPTVLASLGIAAPPGDGRVLGEALAQPSERTTRAGTPATSVRGGTSPVTTLPAGEDRDARPHEGPLLDRHRGGRRGEEGLEGVVGVADVRVGEDEDPLRERDLPLEAHRLREVEQALVAHEALLADVEAGEAAPVEVEEAHVVEDRPPAHPRPEQPQPG